MFCIINLLALAKYFEQARKKRIGKAVAMKSKKATTQAPYSPVVQKMKREIFGSDAPSGEYYIANASGTRVSSGDSIYVSSRWC